MAAKFEVDPELGGNPPVPLPFIVEVNDVDGRKDQYEWLDGDSATGHYSRYTFWGDIRASIQAYRYRFSDEKTAALFKLFFG